jgi:RND family efflux transporter MFP subunit
MKKVKNIFLRRPYVYSLLVLIILAGIGFTTLGGSNSTFETQTISRSTFKRQVAVSGKVVAAQSADLGFEQGGRLASINSTIGSTVTKGTVIASLENGDARAELLQKQAALEREQSELASLTQGTRPEQLTIDRQGYTDASRALVVALRAAQLDTEITLLNDVDTLFENGSSVNPNITFWVSPYSAEAAIENERAAITEKLSTTKKILSQLNESTNATSLHTIARSTLDTLMFTNNFLDHLRTVVENAGLSESEKESYRVVLNTAGQEVAAALNTAQDATATWSKERDTLALSEAGTTQLDLNGQMANVKAAQADVESAQARLRKTLIVAPFDGTVTRMDIKVGEIIASNSSQISLMNTNSFNIESYVPEVHIAHIKPGNPAKVTLDAYDTETVFEAVVATVDPAETIRDGVSTYKVVLSFQSNDSRIKSGMTGSVSIITLEKPDAIMVLQSAIIKRDGLPYIQKKMGEEIVEVLVEIGDSTSLGQVEIISGLSEGDSIVLTPPKN